MFLKPKDSTDKNKKYEHGLMLAKVNMLGCAQITEYGSLSQILYLSINKQVKNKTKKTLQEYLTNRLFKNFTDQSKTLALQLRVQVLHID